MTAQTFTAADRFPCGGAQVAGGGEQVVGNDQLNRLRHMRTRAGLDDATNDWTTLPTPTGPDAEKYRSSYTYDANGNIRTAERWDQAGAPYDALAYGYKEANGAKLLRNRLYQVDDLAGPTNALVNAGPGEQAVDILHTGPSGFDPQDQSIETAYNYRYDELGNLIQDLEEEIAGIDWTVAGKVRTVTRPGGSTLQAVEFAYGAGGQRTEKTVGAGADLQREHYVRDAQGNVMAIYRHQPGGGSFTLKERALYGSSRLGRYVEEVEFIPAPTIPQTQAADDRRLQYELTDHLGNVGTVVTGRLLVGDGAPHEAQVLSAQGYEPFGSLLPGRNYSSDSYRFGFQGQEKDDEMHGATGTSYAFEFRIHDPRVGRFLSLDPLATKYPHNSPYAFSENRVVDGRDLEGAEYIHYYVFLDQGNNLVQKVAVEDFRNMSDAQVRAIHGMSRDEFLEKFSQTFGPEGRGAKYTFFRQGDDGRYNLWGSMWEQWQPKDLSGDGLTRHGFYYGAGCVTEGGPLCGSHGPTTTREESKGANPYDYTVSPIDEPDALARQHDIDYDYPGYVEGTWNSDPNTLPADRAFVNGLRAYLARSNDKNYVDQYTGRAPSTESRRAAKFAIKFFENYVIPKKEKIQEQQKR